MVEGFLREVARECVTEGFYGMWCFCEKKDGRIQTDALRPYIKPTLRKGAEALPYKTNHKTKQWNDEMRRSLHHASNPLQKTA